MRAIRVHEWCQPEDLTIDELPVPDPGPGEVLIRVSHAALNFPDILKIQGKHQRKPERPFIPGAELSGVVEGVGPGADGFRAGQRVFAHTIEGAFTEYAAVNVDAVKPTPDGMSDEDAAVFSLVYQTSHVALIHRGRLAPGETVLVHSAAGGVGLAAVQIAKAKGAGKILATVGSDDKKRIVLDQGADCVTNYETEDFVEMVKSETGGKGANVIYDPVGGDVSTKSLKCIAPEGRLLIIGFTSGEFAHFPSNHILVKNCSVMGLFLNYTDPDARKACWDDLLALYEAGKLEPVIGGTFDMTDIAEAMRFLMSRKAVGKVLLRW